MIQSAMVGDHSHALTRFTGTHFELNFQDGSPKEFGENGTTNEEQLEVLILRLRSLQEMDEGKFACRENEVAIAGLVQAKTALEWRTANRVQRGVEGTDTP